MGSQPSALTVGGLEGGEGAATSISWSEVGKWGVSRVTMRLLRLEQKMNINRVAGISNRGIWRRCFKLQEDKAPCYAFGHGRYPVMHAQFWIEAADISIDRFCRDAEDGCNIGV